MLACDCLDAFVAAWLGCVVKYCLVQLSVAVKFLCSRLCSGVGCRGRGVTGDVSQQQLYVWLGALCWPRLNVLIGHNNTIVVHCDICWCHSGAAVKLLQQAVLGGGVKGGGCLLLGLCHINSCASDKQQDGGSYKCRGASLAPWLTHTVTYVGPTVVLLAGCYYAPSRGGLANVS